MEKAELEGKTRRDPQWLALPIIFLCVGCAAVAACLAQAAILSYSLPALQPLSTATLDLACEDWGCLRACMRQLPRYRLAPVEIPEVDLVNREDGIDIARYKVSEDRKEIQRIATPGVPEYLKPYQEDIPGHQRIWDYFARIIPYDETLHVSYVVFYMDGTRGGSAARIWNLDHKWRLYIDVLDFDDPYSVTDNLVHEYGHMLTLNETQSKAVDWHHVPYIGWNRELLNGALEQCDTFFTGSQCTSDDSYLNAFGNQFWPEDVYDSWAEVLFTGNEDQPEHQAAVDRFYSQYPDRFVTDYAATNPHEDIAESWTAFVLWNKPPGDSIAEQKILFFYGYPELVELRAEIIRGICAYAAGAP